jgi:hypothetical protein
MSETLRLVCILNIRNLSDVIPGGPTEPQQSDPSKAHLHIADNGCYFADCAVTHDGSAANILVDPAFKVEFKVNAEDDLSDEQEGDEGCKVGVNVARKLPALV